MVEEKNISWVVNERLCHTCGACESVCPTQSISFEETTAGLFYPRISRTECTHCGLCATVCPGSHFGAGIMSSLPEDPFVGKALSCWVGKALDLDTFRNGQSGGIVSALLITALELGLIDTTALVVMQPGNPPRPTLRLASTREEILQGQKSKYCPVPVLSALRNLRQRSQPAALVGLPCHIHGFLNIADKFHNVHSVVRYRIGLVCERVFTYAGLSYLVKSSGLYANDAFLLHFKDKTITEYPGDVTVSTQDGDLAIVPARVRFAMKDHFTPARCRLCFDKMNVFADVTVGDPHGIEGIDRHGGESILIVRNQKGLRLVEAAAKAGAVKLREIDYQEVLVGQAITEKRSDWRGHSEAWRSLKREAPDYYEVVKAHAPLRRDKRYLKNMQWALDMDTFPSKEALIERAESKIRRREHLEKSLFKGSLRVFLPSLRWMERNARRMRARNIRRLFGATLSGLTIEVRSINFDNKGSELMLHAILDRIGTSVNHANIVMSSYMQQHTYEKRARLGLYQRMELKGPGMLWGRLDRVIPAYLRREYGIVTDREIDAVLDASGFAYGDQWGPGPTIAAAERFNFWKKQGKKIILLPQAVGPFTSRPINSAFCMIVDNADLVYARDRISYQHAVDLVGERRNLRIAPDFTNLLESKPPLGFDSGEKRFAIVPNFRMIEKTSEADRHRYMPFIVNCVRYLVHKGFRPLVLIHGEGDDVRIGRHLARVFGPEIEVMVETDPLRIKSMIGVCDGVISSRYHGLVSALSQGVPGLATGWSHKYEALMEDYEFPEGLIPVTAEDDLIRERIDFILEAKTRSGLCEKIKNAGERQKDLAKRMWEEVLAVIAGSGQAH